MCSVCTFNTLGIYICVQYAISTQYMKCMTYWFKIGWPK